VEKFASVCDQLLQHPEFLLAHRSFLVNMNYIRRISEIKRLYLAFQMEESI
jgi:DNA-binding LytR/AlgR family response regulator